MQLLRDMKRAFLRSRAGKLREGRTHRHGARLEEDYRRYSELPGHINDACGTVVGRMGAEFLEWCEDCACPAGAGGLCRLLTGRANAWRHRPR